MKFKVGDKIKTVVANNRYFHPLPAGTIGIITDWDKFDKDLPYEVTINDYVYWFGENEIELISERSEETEMPKQKDLYDFDNMTDDDLEILINKANEALMDKKKDRMLRYLDEAIDALKEFQALDHNTAITSEGYDVIDVINELNELRAYCDD